MSSESTSNAQANPQGRNSEPLRSRYENSEGGRKKKEDWWNRAMSWLRKIEISGRWMGVIVVALAAVWMGWSGYGRGEGTDFINGYGLNEEERLKLATELYHLGNNLFEVGKVDQAEVKFREATEMNPGHAFSWANLGNILRDRGHVEEAIRCHERAFRLVPSRARAAYNLGVSLQTAGRYPEAELTYLRAIELANLPAQVYPTRSFTCKQ